MKEYLWTASGFEPFSEAWKYGDISATALSPNLEDGSNKIEGVYKIECPPEVMHFCRQIEMIGGRALLVGGSVRDGIMGLPPKDFDLEIYGIEPEDLMKILAVNFNLRETNTFGKDFEVIKINIEGWNEPLDISIPRMDSKTGEEHRDFEITACPWMSIKEAALRRDLKMNSCAYDPLTGALYDPYHGVENIKNRVIEVTDEKTFQEDPDRIYRIMQFAGRFDFNVVDRTIELCKEMVGLGMLDKISIDRVVVEINKFMEKSVRPSLGMDFLLRTGVIEKYWKELFPLVGLKQNKEWHPEEFVWEHTLQVMDAAAEIAIREGLNDEQRAILVWSAMCHDLGKATTTSLDQKGRIISHGHENAGVEPTLKLFSRFAKPGEPHTGITMEVRKSVAALVKDHLRPKEMWIDVVKKEQRLGGRIGRLARRLGSSGTNIYMLMLLAEADQRGRNGKENIHLSREAVDELIEWQTWLAEKSTEQQAIVGAPKMICKSEFVMSLDPETKGGPWIGAILECVYQDQLEGLVAGDEEVMKKARHYFEILNVRVPAVAFEQNRGERSVWEEIRKSEDPRLYCQPI